MSINYNVFISYHRKDTDKMVELKKIIDKSFRVNTYAVNDNLNVNDMSHQAISKLINDKMKDCNIVLFITGKETYSRVHVEYELKTALSGGNKNRKGAVVVLLDERGDNPNYMNKETLSNRIYENSDYCVITNESDFKKKFLKQFNIALNKSSDSNINVINNQILPEFRKRKYFDN